MKPGSSNEIRKAVVFEHEMYDVKQRIAETLQHGWPKNVPPGPFMRKVEQLAEHLPPIQQTTFTGRARRATGLSAKR